MTSNHGSAGADNESGDAKKPSDKQEGGESKEDKEKAISTAEEDVEDARISDDVDCFLAILLSLKQNDHDHNNDDQQYPPDIPQSSIDKLLSTVELDLTKCENKSDKWFVSVLDAVDRVDKLSTALSAFSSSNDDYRNAADRSSSVLQRAMTFLEEQFRLLLEDSRIKVPASAPRKPPHWSQDSDSSSTLSPSAPKNPNGCEDEVSPPPFPPEIIGRLHRIADAMISAGYGSECFQTFSIARHNAFEEGLSSIGFHSISVDEIKKTQWESLQAVITTWVQSLRQSISVFFPRERGLCESVFSQHRLIARSLFNNLARGVLIHLLNFAEAVTLTKASAEKLFKFLDMYEALQDMLPEMDVLFPGNDEAADLKSEISAARSRLGESAVAMFSDLENSIRADVAKSPVPGGAVHPLTSYVMNYLKYACEYKATLEQVFAEDHQAADAKSPTAPKAAEHTPFAARIIGVMELLDSNLETKSKLYRELALNYVFLMNNGRYIIKKIKESAEIHEVVGDNWYRKRSSEMRQYHKSYQRETWSKALACFKDEGLKGSMLKPALKEKMKSFNAMFEEIHKNQSNWVVCDEQLKSELRVSITAVLVPAYRSFLGKYRQNLSGRQAEKHVKFGPEDIENKIDELFEGNPSNHGHGHGYGLGRRR